MKTKAQVIKENAKNIRLNGYDNYSNITYIFKRIKELLGIKFEKKNKKKAEFLTYDEVRKFLKVCEKYQNGGSEYQKKIGLIGEVLLKTGLRNAEECNLKIEYIDFETHMFRVVEGKGGKDRFGIMPKTLCRVLKMYLGGREKGYVFLSNRGNKFSTRTIQRYIGKLKREAGIEKAITPHSLRHTFATILIRNGVTKEKIKELLGHEDIRTTDIYTHLTIADFEEEVQKVMGRLEEEK